MHRNLEIFFLNFDQILATKNLKKKTLILAVLIFNKFFGYVYSQQIKG